MNKINDNPLHLIVNVWIGVLSGRFRSLRTARREGLATRDVREKHRPDERLALEREMKPGGDFGPILTASGIGWPGARAEASAWVEAWRKTTIGRVDSGLNVPNRGEACSSMVGSRWG